MNLYLNTPKITDIRTLNPEKQAKVSLYLGCAINRKATEIAIQKRSFKGFLSFPTK